MPLFDDLEQFVINDVARRVRKTLSYTRTAELMAMDMRELGYSPNKIRTEVMKRLNADAEYQKIVNENTIQYKKDIKEIIENIVKEAKERGDEIVANSGNMSWIDDMSVWESVGKKLTDKSYLPILVRAMQKSVKGTIVDLAHSTGFKTIGGWEGIETLYRVELNKAIIKLASGTSTSNIAIDVIHTLAQSGLRSVDYASGKSMQLDNAVHLAFRTGCHQLSGEIQKENLASTGENLVYVSTHWGARNIGTGVRNHEEWQGKVYYIKTPDHDLSGEAKRIHQDSIEDLWEKTGYSADDSKTNNPLGLYGYNCRHKIYPWFEGASVVQTPPPEPSPRVVDGKTYDYYAMTQKMRQMERKIRNLKREKEALKVYASKFPQDEIKGRLDEIDALIKLRTKDYKRFCDKCGQTPSTVNLRYEVGTGDLRKTSAYQEYLKLVK